MMNNSYDIYLKTKT